MFRLPQAHVVNPETAQQFQRGLPRYARDDGRTFGAVNFARALEQFPIETDRVVSFPRTRESRATSRAVAPGSPLSRG